MDTPCSARSPFSVRSEGPWSKRGAQGNSAIWMGLGSNEDGYVRLGDGLGVGLRFGCVTTTPSLPSHITHNPPSCSIHWVGLGPEPSTHLSNTGLQRIVACHA